MSKNKKNKKKGGKYSKILTPDQIANFKRFGEPDLSQDWLEIFTPDMYDDIRTIMSSCSDNQQKAEYIEEEWSDLGFETVGLGTNILTMAHPYYPGVVFKVALDNNGIADNFNDFQLSEVVPRFNRCFVRDPGALISVQERLVLLTPYQMDMFMPQILKLLDELSHYFLIADLSPDMRLNYGLTRDGELRIIDGSDLYPLCQMKEKPRCKSIVGEHKHTGEAKYCGGKLKYSPDFKYFICTECGAKYMTLEMRPKKEVTKVLDLYRDGTTAEEREQMANEELAAICHNNQFVSKARSANENKTEVEEPRTIFVDVDEDDDTSTDLKDQREGMNNQDEDDDLDSEGFFSLKPKTNNGPDDDLPDDEEDDKCTDCVEVDLPTFDETDIDETDNDDQQVIVSDPGEDPDVPVVVPVETASSTDTDVVSDQTVVSQVDAEAGVDTQSITESSGIKLSVSKNSPNVKLFLGLCDHLRSSKDPVEASMYTGFLEILTDTVKEALANVTDNSHKNEESSVIRHDEVESSDEVESEPKWVRAMKILEELRTSADPRDQVQLKEIIDTFYEGPDQSVVENENDNNDNTGATDEPVRPDEPHVWYHVVNDTCDESDTQLFPGIFMEISGDDFDEAYDNNGLPLYISFTDDPDTFYKVISATEMKNLMSHSVEDAYYERHASGEERNLEDVENTSVENENTTD